MVLDDIGCVRESERDAQIKIRIHSGLTNRVLNEYKYTVHERTERKTEKAENNKIK